MRLPQWFLLFLGEKKSEGEFARDLPREDSDKKCQWWCQTLFLIPITCVNTSRSYESLYLRQTQRYQRVNKGCVLFLLSYEGIVFLRSHSCQNAILSNDDKKRGFQWYTMISQHSTFRGLSIVISFLFIIVSFLISFRLHLYEELNEPANKAIQ